MEKLLVNKDTLVGEIVNKHPEAVEILMGIGMHCLGCPASQAESLADACGVHGIEPDAVVEAINQKIQESAQDNF